ncbi:chemotaxis response regulator protein-glutamate methylesterase [Sporosarcina sp. 179-K 3D1 HS]|uniref:protein-glutamate methylesterase/protein-glutamine glutaminase n=1 Tax=Sporosarcina sp. 179-K 3D1 HS TaxID=3232169 RepID=UPI0039A2B01F
MNTGNRKRVLVVDDSAFMRKLISDYLSEHPAMEVVGTARNGKMAIEKVAELKPDVVTMDIEMPLMNGLEALKIIMETYPVPVVMLSSTTKAGAENTMLAMEYGAVDFVAKPGGAISLNLHEVKDELLRKVAAATGVQIAHLTRSFLEKTPQDPISEYKNTLRSDEEAPVPVFQNKPAHILHNRISKFEKTFVIIGTSTGGPRALQEVLTRLPASIDFPILIVQHMPPGFTKSLAERLDGLSEITVKEAEDSEVISNGVAYIAPGGKHLKFEKKGVQYFIRLDDSVPPRKGHRPSVDVLLEAAAEHEELNYLTVIMTGMGYDGKLGMERLRKNGKTVTISESEKTAVVYGMPRAIEEAGLADKVLDVQDIPISMMEILKS